ncbi:hypothetical protein TNCV_1606471 [Trichonephila clavipes]|nr:hypothetical protein TNCV_1606471 [Trichonephila clavipes]
MNYRRRKSFASKTYGKETTDTTIDNLSIKEYFLDTRGTMDIYNVIASFAALLCVTVAIVAGHEPIMGKEEVLSISRCIATSSDQPLCDELVGCYSFFPQPFLPKRKKIECRFSRMKYGFCATYRFIKSIFLAREIDFSINRFQIAIPTTPSTNLNLAPSDFHLFLALKKNLM